MSKPSIAKLTPVEREARWKQHTMDVSTNVDAKKKDVRQYAKSITGRSARSNPYLTSLLDPEFAGKGVGVPDEFHSPTFKLQQIVNYKFSNSEEDAVSFAAVVRPHARYTVGTSDQPANELYTLSACTVDYTALRLLGRTPIITLDLETEKVSPALTSGGLSSTVEFPVKNFIPEGSIGPNSLPFRYLSPEVGYVYALDSNFGANQQVLASLYSVVSSGTVAAGDVRMEFRFYDDNLAIVGGGHIVNITAASNPFSFNDYVHSAWVDGGSPSTARWFSIYHFQRDPTAAWATCILSSYSICIKLTNFTSPFASDQVGPLISNWEDCPDIETITTNFDNIRPVSMSVWANYRGDVLKNDSIASKLVYIDAFPMDTQQPVTNYNYLSECDGSYNGPLNSGTYVLWRPTTFNQATNWRKPYDNHWYELPYVVVSGALPQGGVINLRVVINFEAQTNKTLFQLTPSPFDRVSLDDAMAALAHFQPAMENTTHAQKIRDFLLGVAKGVYNYRTPIASALLTGAGGAAYIPAVSSVLNALPNVR